MCKILRPETSRTHIYLLPYIKYNYGHDWATFFHNNRPINSFLIDGEMPKVVCQFEETANLKGIENHPCYVEEFEYSGFPAIVFTFNDAHAYQMFLDGKYSKMYPKFIYEKRDYLFSDFDNGVVIMSYMYSVCTRHDARVTYLSRVLETDPKNITECDTKPDLQTELFNTNNQWENFLEDSSTDLPNSTATNLKKLLQMTSKPQNPSSEMQSEMG